MYKKHKKANAFSALALYKLGYIPNEKRTNYIVRLIKGLKILFLTNLCIYLIFLSSQDQNLNIRIPHPKNKAMSTHIGVDE